MNSYGGYAPTSYGGYDNAAGGYTAAATTSPNGKGGGGGGSSQGDEKSGASAQRLTPLTVGQVLGAVQQHKDDAFSVDGRELSQVAVVGTVRSAAKLSTNVTLVVYDSTGEVEVRQWLDAGESQQEIISGMRIRVVGHVREFQEKRSILAFKIIAVTDPQEAVYHQMLATYVHLFHRFGALPEGGGAPVAEITGANVYGGGGGGGAVAAAANTNQSLQSAVLSFVKASKESSGASKNEIERGLAHLGNPHAINGAIEKLTEDGHLYTTIDDFHFKSSA